MTRRYVHPLSALGQAEIEALVARAKADAIARYSADRLDEAGLLALARHRPDLLDDDDLERLDAIARRGGES